MRIPFPLRSGKYDLRHDSEFELRARPSNFRPGPDPGDDDDDDWGLGTGNLANLRTQNSSGHVLRMEPTEPTESHNLLQQNAFSDENYDEDVNDLTDKLAKYKIGM